MLVVEYSRQKLPYEKVKNMLKLNDNLLTH